MQTPKRQQRSYGFEEESEKKPQVPTNRAKRAEKRQSQDSFEKKPLPTPPKRKHRTRKQKNSFLSWHLLWKIPLGIILFFFRSIAWLFGKKPTFSKNMKGFLYL